MTGTSMDGVSACILESDGIQTRKLIRGIHLPFPIELRHALKELEKNKGILTQDDQSTIEAFTLENIKAIEELLKCDGSIDVIGFHGQTIYHNPAQKISLQIGFPHMIKEHFGIPIASDFRSDDIEKGGQGAPLVPMYHQLLARSLNQYPSAFVNCGGIANITIVTTDGLIGFDTGAGNTLLDRFVSHKTNGKMLYDKDGDYGLAGKVNADALSALYQYSLPQGYLEAPAPKSLDVNQVMLPDELYDLNIQDGCATLAKFTSSSIADAILEYTDPKIVVLSGGGWHNNALQGIALSKQLMS